METEEITSREQTENYWDKVVRSTENMIIPVVTGNDTGSGRNDYVLHVAILQKNPDNLYNNVQIIQDGTMVAQLTNEELDTRIRLDLRKSCHLKCLQHRMLVGLKVTYL